MERKDITYRIIKIGKTAVSVCVIGFMMMGGGVANAYDIAQSAGAISLSSSAASVEVTYWSPTWIGNYAGSNIAINLAAGVDLTGQSGRGTTPLAVYTSGSGSDDNVAFSWNSSSLTLNGNNEITGIVGAHWEGGSVVLADPLTSIAVYNTGNIFNNEVHANNVNLNSGSSVQFLGNLGGTLGGQSTTTNLNYLGSNSQVIIGNNVTLNGNVTNTAISNSALIFNGNGTVTGNVGGSTTAVGTVQVNGSGSTVNVYGNLSTDRLDYQAASTVRVGGDLYLNVNTAVNATNAVTFNNSNGVLQVDGNIYGVTGKQAVTTTVANTGTVTMLGGAQSVTGNVGSSGLAIGTLNIGGTGSDTSTSSTEVSGNVFANSVSLNNGNSTLTMNSGYNLTGTVVTEYNGTGNLTLAGGSQTVTGTVGSDALRLNTVSSGATPANSTFTGAIYATNVTNSGLGTSNYQGSVTATNVGVNAGTSNFQSSLSATTTTIGTGTGNFNGTTSTAIVFSGAGTANLNQGLTGYIDFDNQDGTVNLADTKSISGAVYGDLSNSSNRAGTFNALGGGTLVGAVGKIDALNINRVTATASGDTDGATSKTLLANSSIDASSVKLFNDGVLQLANNVNLTANVTTTTDKTGSLTFNGASTVTGNVGTTSAALKTINAGVTNQIVTFNSGVVYADKLSYSGDGTVVFNGSSPAAVDHTGGVFNSGANDLGFVGTVDFGVNGSNTGTFTLGDKVDLVTVHADASSISTQTSFVDANGATLRFSGSSVVTGDLGSSANSNENFKDIYAGADGSTVSFRGDVYVASTTFHVSGTGKVNFLGDLNGPLVYDANGSVNVADGKNINGPVSLKTGVVNGTGTLNFVGSAATKDHIGASDKMLLEVNFHAATTDGAVLPVTNHDEVVDIAHNVYALTTTVGTSQNDGADGTIANVKANVFLGNALTLAASNVTLNTAGSVTTATAGAVDAGTAVSMVDFAHTKNANGTLSNTATVTQSTTGTGAIQTNGATLNFAVGTMNWSSTDGVGEGGKLATSASSRITGGEGSTLVMNGSETVNISLLGSLRDGQTYQLIDVAGTAQTDPFTSYSALANVNDNSFVIDTTVTQDNSRVNGGLILTAMRGDNVYIAKSGTSGHFSNPAALRLGTLAADGSDYSQDVQTVLNRLDIDQWGFGNNQVNLAVQAKRLAPIANNSLGLSAFRTASVLNDSIGMRMQELRTAQTVKAYDDIGLWVRNLYKVDNQASLGQYDGFKTKISGVTLGTDSHPNRDSIVGAALSYNSTKVEQHDFRLGDTASVNGWHLSLYGAYDITPELFVDGSITAGRFNTQSNRSAVVGRVANADFDTSQLTGKFNLGYRIKFDDTTSTVTPILSIDGTSLRQGAYQETGAGDIGLNVQSQRLNRTQTGLGMRFASTQMWSGMVVKPDLTVMATRDSGNFSKPITAQFIGDYTSQAVFDTSVASKSAYDLTGYRINFGIGMLISKTASMAMRYDYSKNATFKSNALELMARWDFY